MSEAVTAILSREATQALHVEFSHVLAGAIIREVGLEALLGHSNQADLDAAKVSLREEVVMPAIKLGDNMACAIDKYSLDVPAYWSEPCMLEAEFFRDLANLDCKNFGEGPPRFRLEKMRKLLSDDEIKRRLRVICPAIPALFLTETDNRTWGPPTILVKQQVWVSLHPKIESTPRPEAKGYFWFLYHRDRVDASTGQE
jgi:hypothetical protein